MRLLPAVLLVCGLAAPAFARTEKILAYPRAEAWATSVRFIRVDAHLKVTEKDAEAGYVLFELHEDGKTFRGALELADVSDEGRHAVRFVITLEDRPSWQEIALMGKLVGKLRDELGDPAPPAPRDDDAKGDDKDKPKPDDKAKPKPKQDEPPADITAPPISSTP
ncbi:MAG TPA: hypothetical protein VGG28_00475 [Kofleriaceae bacterium]|jgi:hypothetical protein